MHVGLAALGLLSAWMMLSAAELESASFSVWIYGLANWLVFTDAIDFAIRLYVHRWHTARAPATETSADGRLSIDLAAEACGGTRGRAAARPFAIVASVFNLEARLEEFREALRPYRDHVWLISDGSKDHTVTQLRQSGWRCIDDGVNRHKPGALRQLLGLLPANVETVLVIDPDIRIRAPGDGSAAPLERLIADFQQSGAAAACPSIMIEPDGFLGRFQAFEYALGCWLGRRSLADYCVSSGVCLYRRDALARALDRHSLSVYAEDLETALIPGWSYGFIKVYAERLAEIRRVSARGPFATYQFIVYMGVLSLALHPVRVVSAVLLLFGIAAGVDQLFALDLLRTDGPGSPVYFAAASASYLALGLVALFGVVPRAERSYVAPIVPLYLLYVLANVAATTAGFANWFALRLFGRRLYRDHYETHDGGGSFLQQPPGQARI